MSDASSTYAAAAYLERSHVNRGLTGWRLLYKYLLESGACLTLCEVGAGSPHFLRAFPEATRRVAVDVGDLYADQFRAEGIEFVQRDLEAAADLGDLGAFDVVVCSDVFEHLRSPASALAAIARIVKPSGVLISHVPNEFVLGQTSRVMLGRSNSLYFHRDHEEWTDPHVRRFTDIGFKKMLGIVFEHHLKIADMRYGRLCRTLVKLGLPVPYCLEGGPTYVSTNDPSTLARFAARKAELGHVSI